MKVKIASLLFELNTQTRKYRTESKLTQEEFAFLIGRSFNDIQRYEDLTLADSYDLSFVNFYARILNKKPIDFTFKSNIIEPLISINVTKNSSTDFIFYKAKYKSNDKIIEVEQYQIPIIENYNINEKDQIQILSILDKWLSEGYFEEGIIGYKIYIDLLEHAKQGNIILPVSFRVIYIINAINILSSRRKKPKLLPQRKFPKTEEKWLLYKEDI